jgi:hypothetical protein
MNGAGSDEVASQYDCDQKQSVYLRGVGDNDSFYLSHRDSRHSCPEPVVQDYEGPRCIPVYTNTYVRVTKPVDEMTFVTGASDAAL